MSTPNLQERRDGEKPLWATEKRSFDASENRYVVKIFSGDWHVSTKEPEMLVTILGSCIAACIRDTALGIGGMNHFLLPGEPGALPSGDATRYGMFAMETLINGILKNGGRKDRLEIKLFGGANVINNSQQIGSRNAIFVRQFLKDEGLRCISEDLEGDLPRRIHYYPDTGRVMMRKLRRAEDTAVIAEEMRYQSTLRTKPVEGDIDLF